MPCRGSRSGRLPILSLTQRRCRASVLTKRKLEFMDRAIQFLERMFFVLAGVEAVLMVANVLGLFVR